MGDARVCLSRPVRTRCAPRLAPSPDPGVTLARSAASGSRHEQHCRPWSTPDRARRPEPQVCERLGCSARVAGRGSVSASVVPAQRSPDLMSVITGVSVQGTALLMLARSWWPSSPTLTTEPSGTLLTAWPGRCHLTCHMWSHPSWLPSEAQVTATRTRHLPPDDSLTEPPLPPRD